MRAASARVVLRLLIAVALALLAPLARADAPVVLLKSYAGHLNFTGTEATMRNSSSNVCSVVKKNTILSKTLSGIPSGAVVKAAYLYWSGSGNADYQVSFQGSTINAQRKYTGSYSSAGTTYNYFAGVTDVTSIVAAKGNGTYSFGGLTINSGNPYCSVEGVLGGFALLVVYENAAEPFRVLNLYEGFKYTRNSSLTLSLSNFKVPDPMGNTSGRIGHITWEGDQSLNQNGENLSFNGTIMTDSMNPPGNQFDSQSNINGDAASYGIDFDAYTINYPVIKPGDTTATTVYASGQDLVWLNAEIIAVPNVPVVDRAITITRTGDPLQGQPVSYALNVANNGPDPESGTITVSAQVTTGAMVFSGASGTGWTCSVAMTAVTCSYTGTLAVNATLPPLTVTGAASSNGDVAVTATVDGPTFDNVSGNNQATDVYTDTSSTAPYAFTVGQCVAGYAFGDPQQLCTRFDGKFVAGTSQQLYVTALSSGKPAAKVTSGGTAGFKFYFAVSCMSPTAPSSLPITFAGVQMQPCFASASGDMPPSGWSGAITLSFDKGAASNNAPLSFTWADVGLIKLYLTDSSSRSASTRVVSVPKTVRFVLNSIKNADGGLNPGTGKWFARAGEPFKVAVEVLNGAASPIVPPNFGNNDGHGPAVKMSGTAPATYLFDPKFNNAFPGTVVYSGVGTVQMWATIQSGYGPGTYFGVPVSLDPPQNVGDFYPAYFETDTLGGMVCLARMNCLTGKTAAGDDQEVSGAYYSGQPIVATVAAFSEDGVNVTAGLPLVNVFSIQLKPYSLPGTAGAALGLTINSVASNGTLAAGGAALDVRPRIKLPNEYSRSAGATSWTAPTSVFLRAEANFDRVTSGTSTTADKRTSLRSSPSSSKEGGVQLVVGRLKVANAFGSELLKLALPLYAQYWSGVGWENNPSDDDTRVTSAAFLTCTGKLTTGDPRLGGPCNTSLVKTLSGVNVQLTDGRGYLWLQPPGAGNTGGARLAADDPALPYLPSTIGQASFGVYKSRLIYVREVY